MFRIYFNNITNPNTNPNNTSNSLWKRPTVELLEGEAQTQCNANNLIANKPLPQTISNTANHSIRHEDRLVYLDLCTTSKPVNLSHTQLILNPYNKFHLQHTKPAHNKANRRNKDLPHVKLARLHTPEYHVQLITHNSRLLHHNKYKLFHLQHYNTQHIKVKTNKLLIYHLPNRFHTNHYTNTHIATIQPIKASTRFQITPVSINAITQISEFKRNPHP
eukprot:gene3554-2505_t